MKKILFAAAALMIANSASAAVAGTPHDFVAASGTTTMTACQFCHAPHVFVAPNVSVGSMLWNRNEPGVVTANAVSARCFTCHAAANDVYAVNNGDDVAATRAATALVKGLSDSHPVGANYATALADPTKATLALVPVASLPGTTLKSGLVECTSCHDPHQDTAATKFYDLNYTGCALCHAK